jgi:hypothetical protein
VASAFRRKDYGVTFTVSVARPIVPRLLKAQQVTVVLPTLKIDPEAGMQFTGRVPSTLSLAVAVNVAAAPLADVAATVMSPDVVTTGVGASFALDGRRSLQSGFAQSFTSKQPT